MAAEGWRLPEWEPELFREQSAAKAYGLWRNGTLCGCITLMAYPRSGWIGNLLVPPAARGGGCGRRLFRHALARLEGRARIWLTASAAGAPLYRQYGFHPVGSIVRWRCTGQGGGNGGAGSFEALLERDAACWGDDRHSLLGWLAPRGSVLQRGATVALLQPGERLRVLGPWYAPDLCPRECRDVLAAAIAQSPAGAELVLDLPADSPLVSLLPACGFTPGGDNALMVRGEPLSLPPHYSLASLGSVG